MANNDYKVGQTIKIELFEGAIYETPPLPNKEEILFYDKPQKEQKWTRLQVAPPNYDDLPEDEQILLIQQDQHRRRYGVWFYNDGQPTYITGDHYFYLTHWYIAAENDTGYPDYRKANRNHLYHVELCRKDPLSYGQIFITGRRFGKTELALAALYNQTTLNKNRHGGLQSLSMKDAKENLFINRVVRSHKRIHSDFKPITDDPDPKTVLRFTEPITKKKKERVESKESLGSYVDFEETKESGYQGKKLHDILLDEPGTMENMDLISWWNTTKECLKVGNKIIGTAYLPTTLENMTFKGGLSFREMWYASDPKKRDANGHTQSGLYRYFNPAYCGLEGFVDEYGNDKVNEKGELLSKIYLDNQRSAASPEQLEKLKRKFPYTPEEALFVEGSSVFPVGRINDQINYNMGLSDFVRRGQLHWVGTSRQKVEFVDDPNGQWQIAIMPPFDKQNNNEIVSGYLNPLNEGMGGIGVDPFDHDNVTGQRKSNGAIAVFLSPMLTAPTRSNCFSALYLGRPAMAELFFEEAAKAVVFWGMKALIENNRPGCWQYLKKYGLINFVAKVRGDEFSKSTSRDWKEGIATTGDGVREAMVNTGSLYMHHFIGKISAHTQTEKMGIKPEDVIDGLHGFCPINDYLEDWAKFDVTDWTPYDTTVASLLAILQSKRTKIVEVNNGITLTSIFPTYNNSGSRSKIN